MRNVKFDADVVKELRRLVRDSSKGLELQAALSKIYSTGYDNGLAEATKQIRRAVTNVNNQISNSGLGHDGKQLQSDSSIVGTGEGVGSADSDSSEGSSESEPVAPE